MIIILAIIYLNFDLLSKDKYNIKYKPKYFNFEFKMPVSQAKRIAIEAYRLRNLDKYRQWSLEWYHRKRALIPEEQRRGKGRPKKPVLAEPAVPVVKRGRGRPKILNKPPKVSKPVGRPRKLGCAKQPKKMGRPRKVVVETPVETPAEAPAVE